MATLWELLVHPSMAVRETNPANGKNKAAATAAREQLEITLDELDDLLRKKKAPVAKFDDVSRKKDAPLANK